MLEACGAGEAAASSAQGEDCADCQTQSRQWSHFQIEIIDAQDTNAWLIAREKRRRGQRAEHAAVEMEAAELYNLAARHGVRALAVLTVSDHLITGDALPSEQREQSFGEMVEIVNTHLNNFTIQKILDIEMQDNMLAFEI